MWPVHISSTVISSTNRNDSCCQHNSDETVPVWCDAAAPLMIRLMKKACMLTHKESAEDSCAPAFFLSAPDVQKAEWFGNLRMWAPRVSSSLPSALEIRPLWNLYGEVSKHWQRASFYGDGTCRRVDHFRQRRCINKIHSSLTSSITVPNNTELYGAFIMHSSSGLIDT